MKNVLLFCSLTLLITTTTIAQTSSNFSMTPLIAGQGYNLIISGSESDTFTDSLFSKLSETKRKGYIWKFKNVSIPGIKEPVNFQVHQGLSGSNDTTSCAKDNCYTSSYFTTFTSERYKQRRINQSVASEKKAIIIYITGKRKRNHVIKTKEEIDLIEKYLLELYNC